jgi:hypothetical protein
MNTAHGVFPQTITYHISTIYGSSYAVSTVPVL